MVFVSDSVSIGTDSESRNRSRSRLGRIMSLGLVSELQNLVSSVSALYDDGTGMRGKSIFYNPATSHSNVLACVVCKWIVIQVGMRPLLPDQLLVEVALGEVD